VAPIGARRRGRQDAAGRRQDGCSNATPAIGMDRVKILMR
jgi:hypothetical protein